MEFQDINRSNLSVLILAGTRKEDPLIQEFGVQNKAFIKIQNKYCIEWVLDSILNTPELKDSQIFISHPREQTNLFQENLSKYNFSSVINNSNSPVTGIEELMKAPQHPKRGILVITADNPLANQEVIKYFLQNIKTDIAYGVVKRNPLASLTGGIRTWFKINKSTWLSGANIFYFSTACIENYAQLLSKVKIGETHRKTPVKLFSYLSDNIYSLFVLLKVLLQISSLKECNKVLSTFFGFQTELLELPFAYACIDLDKKSDYEEINKIINSDFSEHTLPKYQPQS